MGHDDKRMTHGPGRTADLARTYRDYAEALYHALADDPFYKTMERKVADPARAKDAMLCYYDYSICEAARFGKIVEPGGGPHGVSIWSLPLAEAEAREKKLQKKRLIQREMGESCLAAYEGINAFMSRVAEPLTSDRDWYLSILGILPEHQGKGLGGDLIRPVLNLADAAGIATFLETFTPRNMSFYQRLGYTVAGSFHEPLTESRYWLLRRPPRPAEP